MDTTRAADMVVARHGETAWNAEGRFQGHADVPLHDRGRAQAADLAARLAAGPPFRAVYASDLARAFETAAIVGRRLGLEPVAEPRLREIDVGSWSGCTRSEIEARWPGALARWGAGEDVSDGESRADLAARVHEAVLEIGARHPGQRVLLVAHGGVIRTLQRIVRGRAEAVLENCATWDFAVRNGLVVPAPSPARV